MDLERKIFFILNIALGFIALAMKEIVLEPIPFATGAATIVFALYNVYKLKLHKGV